MSNLEILINKVYPDLAEEDRDIIRQEVSYYLKNSLSVEDAAFFIKNQQTNNTN